MEGVESLAPTRIEKIKILAAWKETKGTTESVAENFLSSVRATPSIPNYKSFQKSWRIKTSQSLIKIWEKNTIIYDIEYVYYENITNKESNYT